MPERRRWLLPLVALALYLLLGFDRHHYWHEWRYVYSGTHYSVGELAAGAFDPGPPNERSADEVGAWYTGQLLHQAILGGVVRTLGPGLGTIRLLLLLYGLFVPLAAWVLSWTLTRLGLSPPAWPAAALLAVSPLGAWLGFKLMAEGPALAFGMGAVALFTVALQAASARARAANVALAAVCLALSFLTMDFMPLLFVGYVAALPALGPSGPAPGRRIAATAVATLAGATLVAGALLSALGLGFADYLVMYGYFREYVKPWEVSLFNVALAGFPFALLLPLAWRSGERTALRFALIWAAVATIPVLIGSSNYVEARYLTAALPACAVLAALGCTRRPKPLTAVVGMALATWIALPFLPYEMSSAELRRLAERTWSARPDAALLVPWNYTDFHYLRVAFPDRPVYLVQSALDDEGRPVRDPAYEARLAAIYPGHYLPDRGALERADLADPVYLGHGRLPPFENLERRATRLGLTAIADRIERMNPMVHLAQSWLWSDPGCALTEIDREGRYRAFAVRCGSDARNRPDSTSSRTEPISTSSR